jgi:hypothetical protein
LPRDFEIDIVSDNELKIIEFEYIEALGRRLPADEKIAEWLTKDKVSINDTVFTAPEFISPAHVAREDGDRFSSETVPFDVNPGEITRWEPPTAEPDIISSDPEQE